MTAHILNFDNKSMSISCWAEKLGVKANTIVYRIKRGWPVGEALGFSKRINELDKKREKRIRKCDCCGIYFTPRQYQLDNGMGKFCSNDCSVFLINSAREGIKVYKNKNGITEIPIDNVNEIFTIRSDGIVRWKSKIHIRNIVGGMAGFITKEGYVSIGIMNKNILAHRIAWVLYYGEWPKKYIDHIDHNRSNNKKDNLRVVSQAVNNKNQIISRLNTSGFTGVSWNKNKNKWETYITVNKVRKLLGYFENKDDAIKERGKANIKYGFHKNHGLKISEMGLMKKSEIGKVR